LNKSSTIIQVSPAVPGATNFKYPNRSNTDSLGTIKNNPMINRHTYSLFLLVSIVTIFYSCTTSKQSSTSSRQKEEIQQQKIYAITNVNIIPMTTENKIIENATVVIKDKKILSINNPVPNKAQFIDGKDKWLIPGLIDMHVHNLADINFSSNYPTKGATLFTDTQDFMLLFVANGVTTAFELSGRVEHFGQRNEIISGKVIGPRIALALLIDEEMHQATWLIHLLMVVKLYA
jgi:hypothetical protein